MTGYFIKVITQEKYFGALFTIQCAYSILNQSNWNSIIIFFRWRAMNYGYAKLSEDGII